MNTKKIFFFDICKEFFDLMHSPYIYYEYEEKKEEVWDEEKGFMAYKELLENVDKEINTCNSSEIGSSAFTQDNTSNATLFGCNLCRIIRKVLLYINPKMYKKLDDAKVE